MTPPGGFGRAGGDLADRREPGGLTDEERRPAVAMLLAGLPLAVFALVLPDERLRVLCWLLAVPMLVSGGVTIGWGNATREIERIRSWRE